MRESYIMTSSGGKFTQPRNHLLCNIEMDHTAAAAPRSGGGVSGLLLPQPPPRRPPGTAVAGEAAGAAPPPWGTSRGRSTVGQRRRRRRVAGTFKQFSAIFSAAVNFHALRCLNRNEIRSASRQSAGHVDRKWRETKQRPSRVRSCNRISCCSISLSFLCGVPPDKCSCF